MCEDSGEPDPQFCESEILSEQDQEQDENFPGVKETSEVSESDFKHDRRDYEAGHEVEPGVVGPGEQHE